MINVCLCLQYASFDETGSRGVFIENAILLSNECERMHFPKGTSGLLHFFDRQFRGDEFAELVFHGVFQGYA